MNSNNWKYISFVLMAVIAIPAVSNVIAPQAFADTLGNILTKINTVYNMVVANLDAKVSTRATQTSVNNLQTTADAIKAKTDTLPLSGGDGGTVKSVTFYKVVNVCSMLNPPCDPIPIIELIPAQLGKTFSGHITMSADHLNPLFRVVVMCDAPFTQIPIGTDTNFSCQRLWLDIHNDGDTDESTDISGVVQYVETSNVSTLP